MREPFAHAMMPGATHDELARQNFVAGFRIHLGKHITPLDELVYEQNAKPRFEMEHGRSPKNHHEVRRLMQSEPTYQMWSAMQRTSKEMLWDQVGESIERQLPALIERSKSKTKPIGSLDLDPSLEVPGYNAGIDIHEMPGGYHSEIAQDDVYAGAMYDRGGYYVVMSLIGEASHQIVEQPGTLIMERAADNAIRYLKETFVDLRPARILDMGCAIGTSSAPYIDAFPEAQVHAIDLAAPQLRYGHARAECLGKKIHFSQQSAEGTNYPDGYFDIVATHAVVHETSGKAIRRILSECHRLLKPGGVTIHSERKFFRGLSPHEAYMNDWDTYNDNEPFKSTLRQMDPRDLLKEAGFNRAKIFSVAASRSADGHPVFVKPGDPRGFNAIFGAQK